MRYDLMATTARRLIGDNGTKVRLVTPIGDPVYDPIANDYIQDYETFDGLAILTSYDESLANNTTIQIGDRKIIAVLPSEPKPSLSKLEVFNKAGSVTDTFQIVNVIPIRPNGETTIAYRLQCRV